MKFCNHLGVVSHKVLYKKGNSYFTYGGFPRQMKALTMLFESVIVCAPVKSVKELPKGLQNLSEIGIKVEELPYVSGLSLFDKFLLLVKLPKIIRIIWNFVSRVDIIQIRIPNYIGLVGSVILKIKRKPAFIWLGGNWWERIKSYKKNLLRNTIASVLKWLILRLTKDFIVFTLDPNMLNESPDLENNRIIIPIVSTSIWSNEVHRRSIKLSKPISLIFVGRLSKEKGVHLLIESLPFLNDKFDWRLTIIGDGPMRNELEKRVKDLGVEKKVKFIGRVERGKIDKFYERAHIIVVPSLSETFAKVIVEAMAHGVVVVASRVGAIGYFLNSDQCVLIDDISPKKIADSIINLVNNRHKFEQLSKKGTSFAQTYTLDSLNRIMEDVISSKFKMRKC